MHRSLFDLRWRAAWVLLASIAWIPERGRSCLGSWFGRLAHQFDRRGRAVVRANLARCLPALDPRERAALERATFETWGRAFADLSIAWFGSRAQVERLVHVEGLEHLDALGGEPVLLVSLHTAGLEAGGIALALARPYDYVAERVPNAAFERALGRRRERFGGLRRVPAHATARALVARLARGGRVHVAPDLAFRAHSTRAIEFCGRVAPTIDVLPRLARLTGARVVPCVTRVRSGGGYVVHVGAPWSAFPSADLDADLRRMNAFFEAEIRAAPQEYRWRHERFASVAAPRGGGAADALRGELWGRGGTGRLRRRDDPSNSATPSHGTSARSLRARAAPRAARSH